MTHGNAVLKIDTETGADEIVAGSLRILGREDGPATVARFQSPVGLWADKFAIYVTDYANDAIRAIDLIPPAAAVSYSFGAAGEFSQTTLGTSSNIVLGHARIQPDLSAKGAIDGFAIFGYRDHGVLVTEASVPGIATNSKWQARSGACGSGEHGSGHR